MVGNRSATGSIREISNPIKVISIASFGVYLMGDIPKQHTRTHHYVGTRGRGTVVAIPHPRPLGQPCGGEEGPEGVRQAADETATFLAVLEHQC